jgi:uncharacterized OB-fold protein
MGTRARQSPFRTRIVAILIWTVRSRSGLRREPVMSHPPAEEVLSAPHVMEYPYRRSLGPVLSRFFTGLRDRRIEGNKTASGRVLVPPAECDPETGESTTAEFVAVGPGGVVTTWAWVSRPRPQHPLAKPFAWALIRLDGADTALLQAVDAGSESAMSTGMRVTAKWADETEGRIQDLACFVAEGGS